MSTVLIRSPGFPVVFGFYLPLRLSQNKGYIFTLYPQRSSIRDQPVWAIATKSSPRPSLRNKAIFQDGIQIPGAA
jgi:hypothetical protein